MHTRTITHLAIGAAHAGRLRDKGTPNLVLSIRASGAVAMSSVPHSVLGASWPEPVHFHSAHMA